MTLLRHRTVPTIDTVAGVVAGLDDRFLSLCQGSETFVAGPTGVFVLADAGQADLRRLAVVAQHTREALAEWLTLVPFVDVLVVGDSPGEVSGRLACQVIGGGPSVLGDAHSRRLLSVLEPAVVTATAHLAGC